MASPSLYDPREKDLTVPNEARRAIFDTVGGPIKFETYNPSAIQLQEGQVLVRILYTGVCHSDLHAKKGDWPFPTKLQTTGEPLVGGHEGSGIVVKLSPGADQWVKLGDRVGIKWIASACLNCDYCREGLETSCPNQLNSGYTVDGTFQQYVAAPAKYVTPIPEKLDLMTAAPVLCAGVTVLRGLKEANLQPGRWVVIPGAGGGLGHLAVQFAAVAGYRVLAIDTGKEKEALVKKLGAEAWIDFRHTQDLVADVKAVTGGIGAHAALVAAASEFAYAQALEYLRPRGTLVAIGLPPGTQVKADVFWTVLTGRKIVGSVVGSRQDALDALRLVERGKVQVIYEVKALSDLNQIYADMEAGKLVGRIVVDADK